MHGGHVDGVAWMGTKSVFSVQFGNNVEIYRNNNNDNNRSRTAV